MLLLFTILLVLAAIASASFFFVRRKSLPHATQSSIDFQTNDRSLFAPDEEELLVWQKELDEKLQAERREELRQNLLVRAESKDYNALLEARAFADKEIYDRVLEILQRSDADKLNDFVTRNGLTPNAGLIEMSLKKLKQTPSASNLTKFVHLSALTNSAEVYLQAVETTRILWKKRQLGEISAGRLVEILESHYWLLAGDARASGEGYVLKEELGTVRREILDNDHEL